MINLFALSFRKKLCSSLQKFETKSPRRNVHQGIKFYQSPWMEPYIRKNTDLRKSASSSFEKDFFKLMNNSVFGKTIENIRKRQNIILVDNRKSALNLSSKPNFDRVTIFDENLIACHMKKTEVYFNKPIYVGQAILDISKTLMFDFHYNYIRKKYNNKAELLFTDTDSLMYLIQVDDFYQDINKDIKKKFDTSDYPENHPSGIKTGVNKKVIGKFKDEAAGKQITHFVGLRPKLYTYKIEEKGETRKAKGVKKNVIKKSLSFEDYKKCLFTEEEVMKEMNIIKSQNHEIFSMTVNKVALSANDDKRLICENKIDTLALRSIKNNKMIKKMTYSEEEIQKYLNILQNFKDGLNIISPVKDENIPPKLHERVSCENCGNTHFFKDGGYRYCKKCFYSVGHVFIKEVTFKDRCCFRQKCIYKREYHYQNKIEEINQKL